MSSKFRHAHLTYVTLTGHAGKWLMGYTEFRSNCTTRVFCFRGIRKAKNAVALCEPVKIFKYEKKKKKMKNTQTEQIIQEKESFK